MPRRRSKDYTREIGVDEKFNSKLMQKLINTIMLRGKKSIARSIVYDAMDILIKKNKGDKDQALAMFEKAVGQIMPHVEVRSRRVGGSVYQVPKEVIPKRKRALALRWLIQAAKSRSNKTMSERLAYELLDAYEGKGGAVRKRTDVQKMAEANRAFSHYAW